MEVYVFTTKDHETNCTGQTESLAIWNRYAIAYWKCEYLMGRSFKCYHRWVSLMTRAFFIATDYRRFSDWIEHNVCRHDNNIERYAVAKEVAIIHLKKKSEDVWDARHNVVFRWSGDYTSAISKRARWIPLTCSSWWRR